MSDIEWCDRTWNPIVGCSRVSDGCTHCYAERFVHRQLSPQHRGLTVLGKGEKGPRWTGEVRLVESALGKPLSWRKPQRVFVNSLSDLWHEGVSNETCAAIFGVMAACPHLTFQVLTKRPERMRAWFAWIERDVPKPAYACAAIASNRFHAGALERRPGGWSTGVTWPLANVWIGVTAEDQQRADERIPLLLETPAAVRFVSYEPALGPVTFAPEWLHLGRCLAIGPAPERFRCGLPAGHDGEDGHPHHALIPSGAPWFGQNALDWLIVGGESGPKARPFDLAWARSAVEQCKGAGTACFVKQLGARPRSYEHGDMRGRFASSKGKDPSEWPADLRVREFPT